MHGMDGFGLLRWMRDHLSSIPDIIVVTAYATVSNSIEAQKFGVRETLPKPISSMILLDHVNRILDFRNDALLSYIRTNITDITSREELACRFHISSSTVTNRIKRLTNLSYRDFIVTCRLEEAKRLLVSTDLTIQQIAHKSGFHSIQAFSRTFHRIANSTATRYRSEIRSIAPECSSATTHSVKVSLLG